MIADDNSFNMAEFQQGSPLAVAHLFEMLYRPLVYFAISITHDKAEAEDIVVECFEKAMMKKMDFDSLPNLRSFLYVATRNACFNYLRSLKVDARSQQELQYLHNPMANDNADLQQIEAEVLSSILEEIETLPTQCRQVFRHVYFGQLDTREIAGRMGISIKTVRNQKARAIRLLQTRLLKKGLLPAVFLLQILINQRMLAEQPASLLA